MAWARSTTPVLQGAGCLPGWHARTCEVGPIGLRGSQISLMGLGLVPLPGDCVPPMMYTLPLGISVAEGYHLQQKAHI